MLKGKKMIIFDMDGTLIDSIGVWNDVDRQLLLHLGETQTGSIDVQARRDESLRRFAGEENPYLAYCGMLGQIYKSSLSAQEIMKLRYDIAQDFLINRIDYKKDADVLLNKLRQRGLKLAIASTTRAGNMQIYRTLNRNILSKAPLDNFFFCIYTQADAEKIKPDPQIHLRLLRETGLSAQECLIFEDSLIGVEAANRAGIEVACIRDAYSAADEALLRARADHYFNDFAQVIAAIEG